MRRFGWLTVDLFFFPAEDKGALYSGPAALYKQDINYAEKKQVSKKEKERQETYLIGKNKTNRL